ncbi:unnamed protein product, partial [Prorocentrum cordatum]
MPVSAAGPADELEAGPARAGPQEQDVACPDVVFFCHRIAVRRGVLRHAAAAPASGPRLRAAHRPRPRRPRPRARVAGWRLHPPAMVYQELCSERCHLRGEQVPRVLGSARLQRPQRR